MPKTIKVRMRLGVETDIEGLWQEIKSYEGMILGGAGGKYTISYIGTPQVALSLIADCLRYAQGEGTLEASFL